MVVYYRMALMFGLLLAATGACAQMPDPALPLSDPPGVWRRLTHDDRTSSSKCIGRFGTPLCAVETVIACIARAESELCDAALAVPLRMQIDSNASKYFSRELYRVEAARVLTGEEIGGPSRYAVSLRPGDVVIEIAARACYEKDWEADNCGPFPTKAEPYVLRRGGARWHVLAWGDGEIAPPSRR